MYAPGFVLAGSPKIYDLAQFMVSVQGFIIQISRSLILSKSVNRLPTFHKKPFQLPAEFEKLLQSLNVCYAKSITTDY